MKRPENLTKTILHAVIGALGVLILGFLGLPYVTQAAYSIMGTENPALKSSGYDVLDSNNPDPTAKETFLYVAVLLLVIFACIMIVSAVLALLDDFGVVSNEMYSKVVKWVLFASALAVLVLTILNIVDTMNKQHASYGVVIPAVKTGLISLILEMICGAGATACAAYNTFKK